MIWVTLMIMGGVVNYVACGTSKSIAGNNTDHVCFREEAFTELIRVPIQQEVRVRSSSWCLEIPPRCSNYKTEMREVIKLENVTKTETIEYCCEGYAEITVTNETICRPICRGGCGRGVCHTPNECHCDPGYIGRHCTHRCQLGRWGDGCRNICKCRNGAFCDNRTGKCRCMEGWIGPECDQACPEGYYGIMCKNTCECSSKKCEPTSGECIPEDRTGPVLSSDIFNGVKQATSPPSLPIRDTSMIIETLNSSIANLTLNIDKLAKNLNRSNAMDSVTVIVPNSMMETTTVKTIHEVILIKPSNIMTDAALVVTSSPDSQSVSANRPTQYVRKSVISRNVTDDDGTDSKEVFRGNTDGSVNAVLVVIAIFSVAILACSIGFVVLYRRHLIKVQRDNQSEKSEGKTESGIDNKVLAKPLPDLPAFTQNITRQSYVPEFYDRPSNNKAVKMNENKYSGVSSEYSIRSLTKPYSQDGSVEHLYDEIKYNTKSQCSRV